MRGSRLDGASSWVVPALAIVAVLPLWAGELPPLTDLPQHAAQVSILRQWQDPACGYPALFEIHWLTPNGLAYALAWGLSFLVDIPTALRLLLSLAVVALALATARAARELGGDPWWALLVLPLAYGFPMSFGFLGFVLAAPVVVALLAPGLRYARSPTLARGLGLGLACAALFAAHVLALAFALLLLGGLVVAEAPSARQWPRRLAPLAIALPVPLAWWWQISHGPRAPSGRILYLGGFSRIRELPSLLTGIPDPGWATLAVAILLAGLLATRPRPSRERSRWLPLAATLAIVLLAPNHALGTSYLAPRFACFLLPTLLFALEAGPVPRWRGARRALLALVAVLLLAGVELRYLGMAREGAGLRATLAAAPAGGRLLYLAHDRGSAHSAETPFIHSGMLHMVGRCGLAERSFARAFHQPVRYRPGVVTPLPPLIEYAPYRFRWDEHGGAGYDLFLVRSAGEPDPRRIAGAEGRLRLLAHRNRWWLYESAVRSAPSP
ncbi:MAG TPA: hypothetical protein VLA66_09235 [Thermoanaerobaculia bacterium]|nr:hypothetical protein [Thermoanaerobaculia bacterium]